MPAPDISQDGTVVLSILLRPSRGLAEVAARRRAAVALLVATIASLLFATVAIPRTDFEAEAAAKIDAGPGAAELTPFQRDEALATARKIGVVKGWMWAATGPALLALLAAAFLWAGFRVAGTAPSFKGALAVVAHGMLPVWLGQLLALPAVVLRAPVAPEVVARILPSSLAALVPGPLAPPLVAALGAIDLFALWALALVALGMARVAGASRARAFVVTTILWLAFVAVVRIALPLLAGGPRGAA